MTDAKGDRPRALVLLSGGLDSAIAIRLMLDQGVGVTTLHFVSAFSPGTGKGGSLRARAVADELGVELIVRDATPDMLEFVANPRFGRGRNMNPCIDCRAYQLGVAKSMLEETGASYVVTGEVLGQRPMSQHRGAMKRIEEAAGLEGLVLRPLTAHNLDPTAPEEKGWVERERLLGISGRSRAEQNKLARMWGLKEHGTPAGGCLLTDRLFAWKLQDLLNYGDGLAANDVHLLKLGRHFRLGPGTRAVVGRNERENAKIVSYRAPGDWMLVAAAGSSPETLLRGETTPEHLDYDRAAPSEPPSPPSMPAEGLAGSRPSRRTDLTEHLEAAARLTARYSKHRRQSEVEIVARPVRSDGPEDRSWLPSAAEERTLRVAAAGEEEIAKLAIRRVGGGTARAEGFAPEETEGEGDVPGDEQVAEVASEESSAEHLPVPVSKEGGGGRLVALRTRGLAEAERSGEVNKTFMGHLMELRARIIVCVLFLVLAMVAALVFFEPLSAIVRQPVESHNAPPRPAAEQIKIIMQRPTDGFIFVLKLGLLGGLVLAFPVIAWQAWRFVSPGLYKREKKAVLPILTVGMFFFAGGCYFAYRFIIPYAIAYLYSFAPLLKFEPTVTATYYMQFFLMIHFAFGLAFETPLVVLALAMMGLVTAGGLVRKWQYIIVGAFVVGALLTPPDVVTQAMMGGSLIVLYMFSIVLAAIFGRKPPALGDEKDREEGEAISPPAGPVDEAKPAG